MLKDEVKLSISDIKKLIFKNPQYLLPRFCGQVRQMAKWLQEVGFSGETLFEMLYKHPSVLSCDLERKIKPLTTFLERENPFGDRALKDITLKNWSLFRYSIARIKARQEVLKDAGGQMTISHVDEC
jgi:hypothetical protein